MWRKLSAVVLIGALVVSLVGPAGPATGDEITETATVQGTVTADGAPVAGVFVGYEDGVAVTDGTGAYTLELPAGVALGIGVKISADDFQPAESIELRALVPDQVVVQDWDLSGLIGTGVITGTVTDAADGTPLEGMPVVANLDVGFTFTRVGITAADGTYSIERLPADGIWVEFFDLAGVYVPQFLDGRAPGIGEPPIVLGVGETRSGVDAALELARQISGTVTDTGGAPLEGIEVVARGVKDGMFDPTAPSPVVVTDADGTYLMIGLARIPYAVEFVDWSGTYLRQYYDGVIPSWSPPDIAALDLVDLTDGSATGIDVVMRPAAAITGQVVSDGQPRDDLILMATLESDPEWGMSAITGVDGSFTVTGLQEGTYTIVVPSNLPPLEWPRFTGIVVAEGQTVDVGVLDIPLVVPSEVPGAPSGVVGVAGDRSVTVTWTAPGSDGGSPIMAYVVSASPGGASCVTSGARSCVVSGLTNGVAYSFRVRASNVVGQGPSSTPSGLVRPRAEVPAPAGFPDVDPTAFFAVAVDWAFEFGITTGVGTTGTYQPDAPVTRGQMVTFLHRLVDVPGGFDPHGFDDVPLSPVPFYEQALRWAWGTGTTTGVGGEPVFDPDGVVTRGQMVTFLWRVAGQPGGFGPHEFGDVPVSPAPFYEQALRWAKATGVTTGVGGLPVFAPDAPVTRGQMATFLLRLAASPDAWAPGTPLPSTVLF